MLLVIRGLQFQKETVGFYWSGGGEVWDSYGGKGSAINYLGGAHLRHCNVK